MSPENPEERAARIRLDRFVDEDPRGLIVHRLPDAHEEAGDE